MHGERGLAQLQVRRWLLWARLCPRDGLCRPQPVHARWDVPGEWRDDVDWLIGHHIDAIGMVCFAFAVGISVDYSV